MKKYLWVFFFVLVIFPLILSAKENVDYYNKHVIILVDQTKDVQDHSYMGSVYNIISDFLKGKDLSHIDKSIPKDFKFNPSTDELSLYSFGLYGNLYDYNTPYGRISYDCNNGQSEITFISSLINSLIQKRESFHEKGVDFETFLNVDLRHLFSKKDSLYHQIRSNSGITLSYYVYPSIIDKMDISIPTKEYYIIIVSNYQSGFTGNSDISDVARLNELTHGNKKYIDAFRNHMKVLEEPFYSIKTFQYKPGFQQNDPVINSFSLKLKSLESTQVYINSNINLKETDYEKTTYYLDDISFAFNYDENVLSIDSLVLKVTNQYDESISKLPLPIKYNSKDKTFSVSGREIDLHRVYAVGEELLMEYVFYTTVKNNDGDKLMPMVFIAERTYEFTENDIVSKFQAKNRRMMYYLIIIISVIFIIWLLFHIYVKRGRNRNVSLKFSIWPITNTKYMEVVDKKVVSYDCWYWQDGEKDRNIPVIGVVDIEKKFFAKKYEYQVEYRIDDIDINEDFSFRPDPLFREKDGSQRVSSEFYSIPFDADGNFNFNVNAYIPQEVDRPNFERDNILKVKLDMRILRMDGTKRIQCGYVSHKYSFIVKPEISNSSLWVAFDPGTTGSCMAYGMSSLQTDDDDIYIVKNEYEDTDGSLKNSPIFPSKICINKTSSSIFNSEKIKAEELKEGKDEDFLFGNEAEIFWDYEKGVNSFQSIKKMLGYTTPQKVKNDLDNIVEVQGADLAHLLVRGLYNHLENYIRKTDVVDKQRHIHSMFINKENNSFNPQRAIVAVPNNYTMIKIQEMVDSIKRLNTFKEVHYIYESEAVMMSYFRKEWSNLEELQNKTFVVYDMGGATINATAFRIIVNVDQYRGKKNIRNIEVETVAKIGYGVGGDDIDFAIIKFIYEIPTIKRYFDENAIDVVMNQRKNKARLIELARRIKLDYIDKVNKLNTNNGDNILSDTSMFYAHIHNIFANVFDINIDSSLSDDDKKYIEEGLESMSQMKQIVFTNVTDSVNELLSSLSQKGEIELIMSGRSVLYPGIKETVIEAIKDNGFNCASPWDGFNTLDGCFDDEKVKTAVAVGACWYAMYSKVIKLEHKYLTSTFGYVDMVEMKPKFIPVITKNDNFDEDGNITKKVEPIYRDLNNVKFIQMIGSNHDQILSNDSLRHKKNILDEVYLNQTVEHIELSVDDKGNFSYGVYVAGMKEPVTIQTNPYSRFTDNAIKTEITDENSEAYTFAISNILELDEDIASNKSEIKLKNKSKNIKRF